MKKNFGKYDIPPTLQRIIDFYNTLGDPEQFYLGFNFYLSLGGFRYFNTPSDVIVFGNIGMDGIHYGFLTDYGSVTDLEVAPIVCVSPMEFERPTRIIAKNLCEFLSVNRNDGGLFYNEFNREEDYLVARNQWIEDAANSPYQPSENEKLIQERVLKFLIENIKVPIIENPYRYVQNVELERKSNISIQTQDGLGVTTPLLKGEKHIQFPFREQTEPDLEMLKEYLYSKPLASRLALFRDIQLNFILEDHQELYNIVIDTMISIGLIDEVNRLSEDT